MPICHGLSTHHRIYRIESNSQQSRTILEISTKRNKKWSILLEQLITSDSIFELVIVLPALLKLFECLTVSNQWI